MPNTPKTWNHRLMRSIYEYPDGEKDVTIALHEVYYDENGKIANWTETPSSIMFDSDSDYFKTLERLEIAFLQPVLDVETGKFVENPPIRLAFRLEWRNGNGQLHREYGPAVIYKNGTKEFWYNGNLLKIIHQDESESHYENGKKFKTVTREGVEILTTGEENE